MALETERTTLENNLIAYITDAANDPEGKTDEQKAAIETEKARLGALVTAKQKEIKTKQTEANNMVKVWRSTGAAVSVGDVGTGLTRQITNVAAGTEDTDAVNVAQLKSAGLRFSGNDNKLITRKMGETLSIEGKKSAAYGNDYSPNNLVTFNDEGTLRIGMLKTPTFTSINIGDEGNSVNLNVDNGKLKSGGQEIVVDNTFKTFLDKYYEFKDGLKVKTEGNKTIISLDKDSLKSDPDFKGDKGDDGKSAYEVWKAQAGNENKSETDFTNAIKGEKGDDGKSAYELWKEIPGNENKSAQEFADSLKGADGKDGKSVKATVTDNSDGTHTLEVTNSDNTKTSTKIKDGKNGKSAYEIWRDNGNTGKTEQQFVDSLNANTKLKERVDTIENTVHNHSREIQQNRNAIAQINRDMQKMNKELRAGIAGAIAIGSLYQNTIPGKETISAGLGSFKGQNAVAVGYSRLSDNGRVGMKANLSINSSGDAGAGASIGYTW